MESVCKLYKQMYVANSHLERADDSAWQTHVSTFTSNHLVLVPACSELYEETWFSSWWLTWRTVRQQTETGWHLTDSFRQRITTGNIRKVSGTAVLHSVTSCCLWWCQTVCGWGPGPLVLLNEVQTVLSTGLQTYALILTSSVIPHDCCLHLQSTNPHTGPDEMFC